jgi:N-acetylmuramoyl-L-alanine amidase
MTDSLAAGRRPMGAAAVALALLTANPAAGAEPAAAPPPTAAAAPPVVVDARVVGDAHRSRFVADVTADVDVAVFTLADPYRIVVDLPEVKFALPDGAGSDVRGLISAFRYGLISPGKSRIVLDMTGPVAIDKSFVIPPADGQPARLVIDTVPATRKAFLEKALAYRDSQAAAVAAKHDRELVPRETPRGGRLVVVVDPGHGGIDTGAYGTKGTVEKDAALAFSKVLGSKLEATGLYDVFYTRQDDSFVALGDRVAFARGHHADLFVSIHANTFWSGNVRGTIVYTISDQASDKVAAEMADSENRSDVLAGIDIDQKDSEDVKDILVDLTRRETRNFGVVFAQNLVSQIKASNRMFKIPHQEAGFKVLEAPDVPSALVELGFISNPEDEKLLNSDDWRNAMANSIVKAIAGYFKTHVAGGALP